MAGNFGGLFPNIPLCDLLLKPALVPYPRFSDEMGDKQFYAKKICFRLTTVRDDTIDRVKTFCRERKVENVAISADGVVVWQSEKPVKLKSGLKTLSNVLKTDLQETDDVYCKTFIENILRRYKDTDFLLLEGSRFWNIVHGGSTRAEQNAYIFKADLVDAMKRGMVEPGKLAALVNDQKVLAGLEQEKERNDDSTCEKTYEFRPYDEDGNPIEKGRVTEITLKFLAGDTTKKKRHYYIYSHASSTGKSTFLKALEKEYNADRVTDTRNWCQVSEHAQLLLFDEYGPSKKLSFEELKGLCSGWGGLNRKSYGVSYQPRQDVQVIICSNRSPFEIYATERCCGAAKRMSADHYDQFMTRFRVYRLDGDISEDRVRYVAGSLLTANERDAAILQFVGPKIPRYRNAEWEDSIEATDVQAQGIVSYMRETLKLAHEMDRSFHGETRHTPVIPLAIFLDKRLPDYSVPFTGLTWYDVARTFWAPNGEIMTGVKRTADLTEQLMKRVRSQWSIEKNAKFFADHGKFLCETAYLDQDFNALFRTGDWTAIFQYLKTGRMSAKAAVETIWEMTKTTDTDKIAQQLFDGSEIFIMHFNCFLKPLMDYLFAPKKSPWDSDEEEDELPVKKKVKT